jgi:hypothetical protein
VYVVIVPAVVAIPEISPVDGLILNPLGRLGEIVKTGPVPPVVTGIPEELLKPTK